MGKTAGMALGVLSARAPNPSLPSHNDALPAQKQPLTNSGVCVKLNARQENSQKLSSRWSIILRAYV
jgi:hypothetical protein